jgi:SH3-like domain-containing protein
MFDSREHFFPNLFFALFISITPFYSLYSSDQAINDLPKHLSLRNSPINMRVGPGKHFPIEWVYNYHGTPFRVITAFRDWYKVEDYKGSRGWINRSLLSRKAKKIVVKKTVVRKTKNPQSPLQATLLPDAIVSVENCHRQLCKVSLKSGNLKFRGYTPSENLWPNEEG